MSDERRHPRSASEPPCWRRSGPSARLPRSLGFNLIELLAVIAIATILAATLTPGLRLAREATERIVCASNLRQIGAGLHAYSADFSERLPSSVHLSLQAYRPQEMMAATAGPNEDSQVRWDGLGLLASNRRPYLDSPAVLYCPSHDGEHPYERYAELFLKPGFAQEIFTNYHYRGPRDRRSMSNLALGGPRRVLVVDGMRTKKDFNHGTGTNRLHADASVDWLADNDRRIHGGLPNGVIEDGLFEAQVYEWLWDQIESDAD